MTPISICVIMKNEEKHMDAFLSSIKKFFQDYPYELVKSKFLKLNSGHLEYVIGCMHDTNTKITNIKAYMVTALYNAPSTINHYYQQEVQHDMYGGGWHEKGIV